MDCWRGAKLTFPCSPAETASSWRNLCPISSHTKGRKITLNEAEAERVRSIFRSYLKSGSLNRLMAELRNAIKPDGSRSWIIADASHAA
jgi:hypothetical protein